MLWRPCLWLAHALAVLARLAEAGAGALTAFARRRRAARVYRALKEDRA